MKIRIKFKKDRSARYRKKLISILIVSSVALAFACSSDPGAPSFAIVAASNSPLQAVAGDAVALKVIAIQTDGSTSDISAATNVAWSGPSTVTALAFDSMDTSPFPDFGATPTAVWLVNPFRDDRHGDLANVLFFLDAGSQAGGSVTVTATLSGAQTGTATATIPVATGPAGDATRGAAIFGANGANCATCHGDTGHGSQPNTDGSFTLENMVYDYPAPGINAEPMNLASDPDWNAALLAVAARSDIDNGGLDLRAPMPDWLTTNDPGTLKLLTTQDFADIYAFLQTQME